MDVVSAPIQLGWAEHIGVPDFEAAEIGNKMVAAGGVKLETVYFVDGIVPEGL